MTYKKLHTRPPPSLLLPLHTHPHPPPSRQPCPALGCYGFVYIPQPFLTWDWSPLLLAGDLCCVGLCSKSTGSMFTSSVCQSYTQVGGMHPELTPLRSSGGRDRVTHRFQDPNNPVAILASPTTLPGLCQTYGNSEKQSAIFFNHLILKMGEMI